MESPLESNGVLVKCLVAAALVSSVTVAAVVVWLRRPATQSRRLIGRCDDALTELEHRSPTYDLRGFQHS